ncbi:MAG: phosphatase PAP2 family protein [Chitinophagales bacterium]|nr:phosphatase PAP2 family protein [Chitinophagales bacterium]
MKQLIKNSLFLKIYIILFISGLLLHFVNEKGVIFLWINEHHSPLQDVIFKYGTFLGDGLFVLIIALILAFMNFGKSFLALLTLAIGGGFAQLMKQVFFSNIVRPSKHFADLDLNFVENVTVYSSHSFPSGHTATAFALFCMLSLMFNKSALNIIFIFLSFLVAYSRIYLVQHFYIDVLIGSLVGVVSAVILFLLIFNRQGFLASKLANSSVGSLFRTS